MAPALAEIVERVRAARAARRALEIRGGGTKAFYGEAPDPSRPTEPLPMQALTGIVSHEPSELYVTALAGTPLAELEAALAAEGQCLPFEPPRFAAGASGPATVAPGGGNGSATAPPGGGNGSTAAAPGGGSGSTAAPPGGGTVGGMVAAGLAGPARAAAGGVRDYVLGATLLNGRGELLAFGGQVMKNVAGYDVSRLLAGSLGVLGAIVEVTLKVLPVAPATTTLRLEMDAATAIRRVNAWAGQPLPLNASAWWSGTLVLRLRGAAAAVQAAQARIGGEVVEPPLAAAFWDGLRDHGDEFFVGAARAVEGGASLWRLSVPATTAPLALSGEQLVEWGGAQRWLCTSAPAATLRAAAAAVGGHAVLFRGRDKSAGVFAPLAPPLARIHRELKRAFDPDGIFNPGRLVPGL